jgi:hypothetical protein
VKCARMRGTANAELGPGVVPAFGQIMCAIILVREETPHSARGNADGCR